MAPFGDVAGNVTVSAPGPLSPVLTLSLTKTCGVAGTAAPTTNCVLPTPPRKVSLSVVGRTVIVVLRVPVQPKLSVAVTATAPFNTVLVGVPDTHAGRRR